MLPETPGWYNSSGETVNLLHSVHTFDQLYRKGVWKRILGKLKHHRHRLLPLTPWQEIVGTGEAIYRGVQPVPIAKIIGTENRFSDFDREFLPLKRQDRYRWARIHALYTEGHPLPPVALLKIGDFYFVRDGHHRISVARAEGALYIDAEVVEIPVPEEMKGIAPEELFHRLEERYFREKTGLQDIHVTVPGGYLELLRLIRCFQCSGCPNSATLREEQATCLPWDVAVSGWYTHCFQKAARAIEESGLLKRFRNRTVADLYLWILENIEPLRRVACFVPPPFPALKRTPKFLSRSPLPLSRSKTTPQ